MTLPAAMSAIGLPYNTLVVAAGVAAVGFAAGVLLIGMFGRMAPAEV